jgi:hypothetical protein
MALFPGYSEFAVGLDNPPLTTNFAGQKKGNCPDKFKKINVQIWHTM